MCKKSPLLNTFHDICVKRVQNINKKVHYFIISRDICKKSPKYSFNGTCV